MKESPMCEIYVVPLGWHSLYLIPISTTVFHLNDGTLAALTIIFFFTYYLFLGLTAVRIML